MAASSPFLILLILLFLLSSVSSITPLDPNQLEALRSINLPISNNSLLCIPSSNCDNNQPFRHLISLTISNCSDEVTLSFTALQSLSSLTSLTFIDCHISTIRFPLQLTQHLNSFTSIRSLRKLTGVWLSKLTNLVNLTVIGVPVNASSSKIILQGMKFLQFITLSQCDLRGSIPRNLSPDLMFIDLSGNRLMGKIPYSLTQLTTLRHLNLASNSLNDTIPITIGDLVSLQNLSLASNRFSGHIPDSLSALSELTRLDLGSNGFTGKIPNFLNDMKKLKYLNLERNDFQGILPFNATFIKRMEFFRVSENYNLCYNVSVLGLNKKLGIAPCDENGMPISPSPSPSPLYELAGDDDDDGSLEQKKSVNNGQRKVVVGVAIALSAIVFLVVFLVCLSKCCK